MSAHPEAVGAAALEFGASLPQNPANITGATWMAALHKALETYEAKRGEPLVEAYMRHVIDTEGVTLLHHEPLGAEHPLTIDQRRALLEIEIGVRDEN
jgi:hypothetical protein